MLVRRPAGLLALGLVASGDLIYTHFWSGAFLPDKLPLFLIGIGSYHLYANAEKLKSFRYRPHVLAGLAAAVLATGWHWLALLIWLVVFGCVLADGNNPAEQFMLKPRRFLLRPAMQFVGKISYPLYLVHWPVILCLMAGLIWWQPGISSGKALALMFVAGLPVILFAAWLLHISVEKPLMQFGKKFIR